MTRDEQAGLDDFGQLAKDANRAHTEKVRHTPTLPEPTAASASFGFGKTELGPGRTHTAIRDHQPAQSVKGRVYSAADAIDKLYSSERAHMWRAGAAMVAVIVLCVVIVLSWFR